MANKNYISTEKLMSKNFRYCEEPVFGKVKQFSIDLGEPFDVIHFQILMNLVINGGYLSVSDFRTKITSERDALEIPNIGRIKLERLKGAISKLGLPPLEREEKRNHPVVLQERERCARLAEQFEGIGKKIAEIIRRGDWP